MKRRFGMLFMCLGTVLMIAALSLFLYNGAEDRTAGEKSQQIVDLLVEKMDAPAPQTPEATDGGEPTIPETVPVPDPFDTTMTEVEIDGYRYVGYLEIPALEIKLPVMSDWSYEQLKVAPCRYSGSSKSDDLVIMAHNYGVHFGYLPNLAAGDRMYFTDMDGAVAVYEVVAREVLMPTDVEDMTAGAFDLTLFTCTYGGRSRVTVRCDRVEE